MRKRFAIWFAVALLIGFSVGMIVKDSVWQLSAAQSTKWEYACIKFPGDVAKPKGRKALNKWGKAGWEIIHMHGFICFKRPLK